MPPLEPAARSRRRNPRRAASGEVASSGNSTSKSSSATWLLALAGSLLLFMAQPPLGWWPLAWIAPVPWVWLVRLPHLPGKRPYLAIYAAGCCYWLGSAHWLRLPHPLSFVGWIALALYMGVYLPLFIGLARVAAQRLRWSLVLAAPLVWMGVELLETYVLGGFCLGFLCHTQYRQPLVIQVADLAGEHLLSFVMILVAASIARALPLGESPRKPAALIPAALLLAAVLGYGAWRIATTETHPGPTIALIQGSIDTYVKQDPSEAVTVQRQYTELSARAAAEAPQLDLIVWPETMFRQTYVTATADAPGPEEEHWTPAELQAKVADNTKWLLELVPKLGKPMLLGVDTIDYTRAGAERYNSALLVAPDGTIGPRYDKMHPVMFGEYVPLAKRFPWLYKLTPLSGGIDVGTRMTAFPAGRATLAASICYESVISRVIRRQVRTLIDRGEEPDVLVNLTNDGWFRGSSELDQHVACDVFRAVECRKPLVAAANTGFSVWIDSCGRIVKQGKRRETDVIIAAVELDPRHSPYLTIGDLPSGLCLAVCVGLFGLGWYERRKVRSEKTLETIS